MSMSLQRKLLNSIPLLFSASRSERSSIGNLIERTLTSHYRTLSTTTTSHRLNKLGKFHIDKESETYTIRFKTSEENYICTSTTNYFSKSKWFSTSTNFLAKKAQKTKGKTKKLSLNQDEAEGIVDLKSLKNKMEDALVDMSDELAAKVPMRITSGFLDNIMVDTGKVKKTPLYEMAQVKTNNDSFLIEVQSSFPNATKLIASAISDTGFNMQPSIKGSIITVPIPLFSSDYKGSLEKIAKGIANQTKEALRKVRQKGMVDIRNNKEGQSKDLIHRIESQVQQLTNYYNERVDTTYEKKVKEINK